MIKGHVTLSALDGRILAEQENVVCTGSSILLAGATANLGYPVVSYCCVGTGNTTPVNTDTQLTAETARVPVTNSSAPSTIATIQALLTASLCPVNIQELGLFGGAASLTLNSGTIFSHALLSYNNSLTPQDLIVTWTISYS
jgi:hypothetical protein